MNWQVEYYPRKLPLVTITDEVANWCDLPKFGVVSVTINSGRYKMKMSGVDAYWVHGDEFGAYTHSGFRGLFNTSYRYLAGFESTRYKNSGGYAYRWSPGGQVERIDPVVPDDAYVIYGIMMPDNEARIAGVL